MKLYDNQRAPNPRRVRIYLAEKGIEVPTVPVDLMALAQVARWRDTVSSRPSAKA